MPQYVEIEDEALATCAMHVQRMYALLDKLDVTHFGTDRFRALLDYCSAGERQLVSQVDAALVKAGKRPDRFTQVLCGDVCILVSADDGGFGFVSISPRLQPRI